jgi:hypothetical protein
VSVARSKQDLAALRAKTKARAEIHFIVAPSWSISDELRDRLPEGVSWIGPFCWAKEGTVVIGIEGVIPVSTPRATVEAEAKRLLAAAVADHYRLMQQSIRLARANLIRAGIDPDEVLRAANPKPAPEAATPEEK